MKFTIQFTGRDEMAVHKAGCADLAKSRNVGESRETVNATSAKAAILAVLGDESDDSTLAGMGYTTSDFHILPCATKA